MEDKKRVIMVTGGSGLVGRNLEQLVNHENLPNEKFIFLTSNDANLQNPEDVRQLFKKIKPDVVIHLAANVGGLFKNMRQNLSILKSNMYINENVLACAFEYNVNKVISCLSTCIFPDKISYPIDETMIHNGPPNDSNYGYSYSKRYIEILHRHGLYIF
uniref:GDP-L-fucose synthase (Trinotate prediction) n=1 Tax=Myxobolus squamalis TaxID=59785 RepID=A0A6B2G1U3_MYXSQ